MFALLMIISPYKQPFYISELCRHKSCGKDESQHYNHYSEENQHPIVHEQVQFEVAAIENWKEFDNSIIRTCSSMRGDKRIYHRSPTQKDKSLPEGKRTMLETRFTELYPYNFRQSTLDVSNTVISKSFLLK